MTDIFYKHEIDLFLGIPTYNSSPFLDDLFRSLLAQCAKPRRIIFSDDGSRDNTVARLHAFREAHPELGAEVVVQPHNLGISGNYNALVGQNTTCTWIQILDADDYYLGEYFSELGAVIREHPTASVIVTSLRSKIRIWNAVLRFCELVLPKRLPRFLPVLGSLSTRSGLVYRAQALREHPFSDQHDGSDVMHAYPLLADNRYAPACKVYYRIHTESLTSAEVKRGLARPHPRYKRFLAELPLVTRLFYALDFKLRQFIRERIRKG